MKSHDGTFRFLLPIVQVPPCKFTESEYSVKRQSLLVQVYTRYVLYVNLQVYISVPVLSTTVVLVISTVRTVQCSRSYSRVPVRPYSSTVYSYWVLAVYLYLQMLVQRLVQYDRTCTSTL